MSIDWKKYDPGECYDELISTPGYARAAARNLTSWLRGLSEEDLQARKVPLVLPVRKVRLATMVLMAQRVRPVLKGRKVPSVRLVLLVRPVAMELMARRVRPVLKARKAPVGDQKRAVDARGAAGLGKLGDAPRSEADGGGVGEIGRRAHEVTFLRW